MFQNYMASLKELDDAFGSLNFIKCCHKSDNTYFNYGFPTLLWRLVDTKQHNFGTSDILILKFFMILLSYTKHVICNPVVAYHKNYLPIFQRHISNGTLESNFSHLFVNVASKY